MSAVCLKVDDLVSVVMPVFNPDFHMLREAVKSVLLQDYEPLELIIVEDPGNADASVAVDFKDDRIVYIKNPVRTSFVTQLNMGVERARGRLIARMDSDDLCESGRLSRQVEFLREHPDISIVGTNLVIIDAFGDRMGFRKYPETSESIAWEFRRRNVIAHPSSMFYRADFLSVNGYREEFGLIADYDLWCRMLMAGKKFHNMQEYLLRYRVHAGASKVKSLKETIRKTMLIKSIHFRGRKGLWNASDEIRYEMERILLGLPDWVVMKFFMWSMLDRKS